MLRQPLYYLVLQYPTEECDILCTCITRTARSSTPQRLPKPINGNDYTRERNSERIRVTKRECTRMLHRNDGMHTHVARYAYNLLGFRLSDGVNIKERDRLYSKRHEI